MVSNVGPLKCKYLGFEISVWELFVLLYTLEGLLAKYGLVHSRWFGSCMIVWLDCIVGVGGNVAL